MNIFWLPYLIICTLADSARFYSAGTFICLCFLQIYEFYNITYLYSERERMQEQVKQRTVSLWSYTNSQLPLYLNPLYRSGTNYQLILMPVASMRYIKPWKSLYCRWNPSMRQQVCKIISNILINIMWVEKYWTILINALFSAFYVSRILCIKEQESF